MLYKGFLSTFRATVPAGLRRRNSGRAVRQGVTKRSPRHVKGFPDIHPRHSEALHPCSYVIVLCSSRERGLGGHTRGGAGVAES